MACKTETKQIDEHEISVTQWPADKAILIKLKLIKAFGASLAVLASASDSNDESDIDAISEGILILFKSTEPEELVSLIKQCVIGVAYDGKRITESSINELFSGDELMQLYKIFIFALQVNYSNLLGGQLAERFLAKMKDAV